MCVLKRDKARERGRERIMHWVYNHAARERARTRISIRASKLVAQQLFSDLPIVFSGPLRHIADCTWAKNPIGVFSSSSSGLPCPACASLLRAAWWQTARPQFDCQSSTLAVFVRSWCIIYIIAQCLYYWRIHFGILRALKMYTVKRYGLNQVEKMNGCNFNFNPFLSFSSSTVSLPNVRPAFTG